ncbi:Sperm-associated antigen 16 protein [Blyttiomyces sp. JEL0837]|nr:Sperm-associated antigen 16 protein [Blyttiomyces sp. JEL0837]
MAMVAKQHLADMEERLGIEEETEADQIQKTGGAYYLEAVRYDVEESDEDIDYQEVPIEEFEEYSDSEGEETLEKAVRNINERSFFTSSVEPNVKSEELVANLKQRPEVIDDYIRNYLSSKGLLKSLEAFQNEWYEFQQQNKLTPEDVCVVPDVYHKNQELADSLQKLRVDVENYKEIASKARATYDKLRKERDFHRMHHKRVVQEKNRLIGDIKRLKKHYESYEPTLKNLRHRYEVAMKEKMLIKLERDKLLAKVQAFESSLKDRNGKDLMAVLASQPPPRPINNNPANTVRKEKDYVNQNGPSPRDQKLAQVKKVSGPKESKLPMEDRENIYIGVDLPAAKVDRLKQIHSVRAHEMAISSLKFHPKKMIFATVSDDKLWKMWAFPSGELIMSGEGHKDWIADCDFHPRGAHLATASGDGTIKIWDFAKGIATVTLGDHTQAGDVVASCDADGIVKFWDIRNVSELESIDFGPHPANKLAFDPSATTLAVASNDGSTKLYNIRDKKRLRDLSWHTDAVQTVAFDRAAEFLISAGSDGTFRVFQ